MDTPENSIALDDLRIPASPETPEVYCSVGKGEILLKGNLIAHDPNRFFARIFSWLDQYLFDYHPQQLYVQLHLTYVNGCSEKCVYALLQRLEKLDAKGISVKVDCKYEHDDDDMQNWAKELREVLRLPINLVEIN